MPLFKQNTTLHETMKIVIGEAVVTALICAVFALLKKFTLSVLWGALLGSALNILYFVLLCIGVNRTLDRSRKVQETDEEQETVQPDYSMTASYLVRLVILGAGLVLGLKSPYFNNIALVIPVFMTRPILTVTELLKKEVK